MFYLAGKKVSRSRTKLTAAINMNKIQISPEKKIDDALVIWHEQTPDVDIVVDARPPYGLKMKPGSVKVLYVFGLLGITKADQIVKMLKSFVDLLEKDGELYIIEQDFDYILRSLLGGDLSLQEFNKDYLRTTYLNQDEIVHLLEKVGFPAKDQVWWQSSPKFTKKNSEVIIMAKKNNLQ